MRTAAAHVARRRRLKLFAALEGPRQRLALYFHACTTAPLTLVLPVPLAADAGPDDLHEVPLDERAAYWFFSILERGFPNIRPRLVGEEVDCLCRECRSYSTIATIENAVGARLPLTLAVSRAAASTEMRPAIARVVEAIPLFVDWGFALMTIEPGEWEIRTTALAFRTRYPGALYLPTMHTSLDTGELVDYAHDLYFQGLDAPRMSGRSLELPPGPSPLHPWLRMLDGSHIKRTIEPLRQSQGNAGEFAPDLSGIVVPDASIFRVALFGGLYNDLVFITSGAAE